MTKVKEVKKIKNDATVWATVLLITLKRHDLVQNFIWKNYSKYGLDPARILIRNRNFSEVGTRSRPGTEIQ